MDVKEKKGAKKKQIFRIVTTSVALLILSICCLAGCHKEVHEMTIDEIRQKTIDAFYKDGKPDIQHWIDDANTPELTDSFIEEVNNLQDITGFDIQLVKDVDGNKVWFLVEFEPIGFIFGHIQKEYTINRFRCFPSPFKILNIDSENRYIDANIWGMNQYVIFATMRNNILTSIEAEELKDDRYFQNREDSSPRVRTYDYKTRRWVMHY